MAEIGIEGTIPVLVAAATDDIGLIIGCTYKQVQGCILYNLFFRKQINSDLCK